MRPDTFGRVDVGAGDMNGHRPCRRIHLHDGFDEFLRESLADQVVAFLDQFRRREAPLVSAPHEERVLGCRLDPAVDDHEPVVFAEFHGLHAGHGRLGAAHAPVREPLVLRLVRHVRREPWNLNRCDLIAGLEVLNRRDAAVAEADERAEEQAVRPAAPSTASTAASSATASTTPSSATTAPASSSTRRATATTAAGGASATRPAPA